MSDDLPDKYIKVEEHVVDQLAGVADTMGQLLARVIDKHEGQSRDLDYLRQDLGSALESIRHIAKVLHEGNGDKPLISRVSFLEFQMANLLKEREEEKEEALAAKKLEEEKSLIDKKGRYALYTALATGILGLAAGIVSLFAG